MLISIISFIYLSSRVLKWLERAHPNPEFYFGFLSNSAPINSFFPSLYPLYSL